jgi:isopenicillin-N epimerase
MQIKEKEAPRQEDVETPVEEVVSAGSVSRRNFLKFGSLAVAGGAVALTLPKAAEAKKPKDPPKIKGEGEKFWKDVQKKFTLDKKKVYMNIGTTGSMPKHVIKNLDYYVKLVAKHPWDRGGEFPSTTAMRQAIAPGFGCDYKELWMSENTTNGVAQIFNGLPFEAGDVILTTVHEHSAGWGPMYRIRDRYGVRLKIITLPIRPTSGEEYVAAFQAGINEVIYETGTPPKVIFFTHTPYKTGAALPAKEICALGREYGCVTVLDGAHNTGMFNLDFDDMGCDFYSGSGHKWQCGPGRTGIAYVRNQGGNLPAVWITEGRYRADAQLRSEGDDLAGLFQSHGNPNYPAYRALHDSCMFWDSIGRQNIFDRVRDLSAYTKEKIAEYFGDSDPELFWCPSARELSSGLTTFNPFEDKESRGLAYEYRERLREEYGYIIRYSNFYRTAEDMLVDSPPPQTYVMRISTHLFHTYDQVDGLVEALYDLYERMTSGDLAASSRRIRKRGIDDNDDDFYC